MRVVVAGGVGFIGRHLVRYLVENSLASKVLVLDKVLPEVAGLSEAEMAVFKGDSVIFKQMNLAREGMFIESSNLQHHGCILIYFL